ETQYWIELLFQTDYLDKKQYESILTDSVELGKMLSSITKKLQPNGRQSSTVNNH
ncbi:four helix bundle protein, partial [uncultured Prevotella sp.]